jgi:hypothetical protein
MYQLMIRSSLKVGVMLTKVLAEKMGQERGKNSSK